MQKELIQSYIIILIYLEYMKFKIYSTSTNIKNSYTNDPSSDEICWQKT